MRRLDSLDLLALVWVYADAVAIVNRMNNLPSDTYESRMLNGLSKTAVRKTMLEKSLTGDANLDKILLEYHNKDWCKQDALDKLIEELIFK